MRSDVPWGFQVLLLRPLFIPHEHPDGSGFGALKPDDGCEKCENQCGNEVVGSSEKKVLHGGIGVGLLRKGWENSGHGANGANLTVSDS